MKVEVTGAETAEDLVKQLVYLRARARQVIRLKNHMRRELKALDSMLESVTPGSVEHGRVVALREQVQEALLQKDFDELVIGQYLPRLCAAVDRKVPRDRVFEALNVNRADRTSEATRKYGGDTLKLIWVLKAENSAGGQNQDIEQQPLAWCMTMAFMHELHTNKRFDRTVHDGANEFFNGAFGEYREKPLIERLVGRGV